MPLFANFFGLGIPELIVLALLGLLFVAGLIIVLTVLLRHTGGEKLPLDDDTVRHGD